MLNGILLPRRTDEEKELRRKVGDYGGLHFSKTAFDFRSTISRTITTIEKDNQILEVYSLDESQIEQLVKSKSRKK